MSSIKVSDENNQRYEKLHSDVGEIKISSRDGDDNNQSKYIGSHMPEALPFPPSGESVDQEFDVPKGVRKIVLKFSNKKLTGSLSSKKKTIENTIPAVPIQYVTGFHYLNKERRNPLFYPPKRVLASRISQIAVSLS